MVRRVEPLNAETRLELQDGLITPNESFYIRCNFPLPTGWSGLELAGLVDRPAGRVSLEHFGRRRLVATLECAGNARAFLTPPTPGDQWELGAVSTAEWAGVSLAEVLAQAGLDSTAREVVFDCADGYARSLPVERALHPDTLLATEMNGVPLPAEHGGPLRLLVPGWYGMASAKWVTRITPVADPFRGHFQVEKYVIGDRPVREMEVRSVIVAAGSDGVRGFAWSGLGAISSVELSIDGGATWTRSRLGDEAPPYGWTAWRHDWTPDPGTYTLISRATDGSGRVQPLDQNWNELGYANNQARPLRVTVR